MSAAATTNRTGPGHDHAGLTAAEVRCRRARDGFNELPAVSQPGLLASMLAVVLARRIPAVESLGAVTVLCVDKTGTLTANRMTVRRILAEGESFDLHRLPSEPLPESMHETVEYSILASRPDPFDPMERAFKHGRKNLRPCR